VVVPTLILFGLMAIPYLDVNRAGDGYYTINQRKFAYVTFQFGFLMLWILLILVGTFSVPLGIFPIAGLVLLEHVQFTGSALNALLHAKTEATTHRCIFKLQPIGLHDARASIYPGHLDTGSREKTAHLWPDLPGRHSD
jgi:hypothetical protein